VAPPLTVVTEARKTTVEAVILGEETADSHNNNGSHGTSHLGNNGVLGIIHRALTQPQTGTNLIMGLKHNRVEFLDLNLNRLLSMSTLLAQPTLQMLSALSTLLS